MRTNRYLFRAITVVFGAARRRLLTEAELRVDASDRLGALLVIIGDMLGIQSGAASNVPDGRCGDPTCRDCYPTGLS